MTQIVRYRVPEAERRERTEQNGDGVRRVVTGSVHHPDLAEFTGFVTRSYDDARHDIVIFPPGHVPVHVARVPEAVEGSPTEGTVTIDHGYLHRPPRPGADRR